MFIFIEVEASEAGFEMAVFFPVEGFKGVKGGKPHKSSPRAVPYF
jgi:hypothetical protein